MIYGGTRSQVAVIYLVYPGEIFTNVCAIMSLSCTICLQTDPTPGVCYDVIGQLLFQKSLLKQQLPQFILASKLKLSANY